MIALPFVPIYEYQCKSCEKHFEYTQRMSEDPKTECEACGGALERLISATAFHLKGGGWYKDLYASKKPEADTSGKESGSSDSSSATSDSSSSSSDGSSSSSDGSSSSSSDSSKSSASSDSSGSSGSGSSSSASGGD